MQLSICSALKRRPITQVVRCYLNTCRNLEHGLSDLNRVLLKTVESEQRFALAIQTLRFLKSECDRGLAEHVPDLGFDVSMSLDQVEREKVQHDTDVKQDILQPSQLPKIKARLDRLERCYFSWFQGDYDDFLFALKPAIHKVLELAEDALEENSFEQLREHAELLTAIHQGLAPHCRGVSSHLDLIVGKLAMRRQQLLEDLSSALTGRNFSRYEALFAVFHELVLNSPRADAKEECASLQETVHRDLARFIAAEVEELESRLAKHDFAEARCQVGSLREVGAFMMSLFALYHADFRARKTAGSVNDDALKKLTEQCHTHFGDATLTKIGRWYALLGVSGGASERAINDAFKRLSLRWHPDRCNKNRATEIMQKLNEARDELCSTGAAERFRRAKQQAFSERLAKLPATLRETMQSRLDDGVYDEAADILLKLEELPALAVLARPPFDVVALRSRLETLVVSHVKVIRAGMTKNWSLRLLDELNRNFVSLDNAEKSFSANPAICAESWSQAAYEAVETDIGSLAGVLLEHLRRDEQAAIGELADFVRAASFFCLFRSSTPTRVSALRFASRCV